MKVISEGVTYHVEVHGEGEPLLLLHGFTGSWKTWEFLLPYLEKEYMLIIPDIVGHGRTASPDNALRYDIKCVARDMKNILESLQLTSAHILGYSMGGRLALATACLYPEWTTSLLLESTSPGLQTEGERRERQQRDSMLATQILEQGVSQFVNKWENIPLFATQQRKLSSSQKKAQREERLQHSAKGLANSLLGMGTGSQPSFWEKLSLIECPVFLITGELDDKFCNIARAMERDIKNVKWLTVSDAGHAIHVEEPKKFVTIVKEFLYKNSEI